MSGDDASDDTPRHSLVEALLALASDDGLGNRLPWTDISATISALMDDPYAESDLRKFLAALNDISVAETLKSWLERYRDQRNTEGRDASRGEEKILTPMQASGFTVTGGAVLATAIGTLSIPIGGPIIILFGGFAATCTWGRWVLSRRKDAASDDCELLSKYIGLVEKKINP